jgi:hypothetical protein
VINTSTNGEKGRQVDRGERERIRINFGEPEGRKVTTRARESRETKLDKAGGCGTGEEKRSEEDVGSQMRFKNERQSELIHNPDSGRRRGGRQRRRSRRRKGHINGGEERMLLEPGERGGEEAGKEQYI